MLDSFCLNFQAGDLSFSFTAHVCEAASSGRGYNNLHGERASPQDAHPNGKTAKRARRLKEHDQYMEFDVSVGKYLSAQTSGFLSDSER